MPTPFVFHGSVRAGYQRACARPSPLLCPEAYLNMFSSGLLQHRHGYQCACAHPSHLLCPVTYLNMFSSELLQHTQKWTIIRQNRDRCGQAPEVADAFSPSENCCVEAPRIILCRQCKVFFLFY